MCVRDSSTARSSDTSGGIPRHHTRGCLRHGSVAAHFLPFATDTDGEGARAHELGLAGGCSRQALLGDATAMLVARSLPIVPGNLGDALGATGEDRLEGGALRRASRRTAMMSSTRTCWCPSGASPGSRSAYRERCVLCWMSASDERAVRGGTTPRPRNRGPQVQVRPEA